MKLTIRCDLTEAESSGYRTRPDAARYLQINLSQDAEALFAQRGKEVNAEIRDDKNNVLWSDRQ